MDNIVILGGGLAGLYSAFRLRKIQAIQKITVVEASNRVGGWVHSHKTKGGVIYEMGPRTVRFNKRGWHLLDLVQELGLANKCIGYNRSHPAATDRRIKVNGKLHKVPMGFNGLLSQREPFSEPIMKSLVRNLWLNELPGTDESLHLFAERLAGPEVAKYLVDPIARGIFAGSSKHLSIQALLSSANVSHMGTISFLLDPIFKSIANSSYKTPSSGVVEDAIENQWKLWTLDGGMEKLIHELALWLKTNRVDLITGVECTKINFRHNDVEISTQNGSIYASSVISALPANRLSSLVSNIDGGKLSGLLNQIPYVTVGMVHLEFDGNIIDEASFGYLIPSSESGNILGVIYDTCIKPQGNRTIFTVMMGGHWFEEGFGENVLEDHLLEEAIKEVTQTLQLKQLPAAHKVSIHRNCIPQYIVGHKKRVNDITECLAVNRLPLILVGNSYNGVGLNDVIHNVTEALKAFEPLSM